MYIQEYNDIYLINKKTEGKRTVNSTRTNKSMLISAPRTTPTKGATRTYTHAPPSGSGGGDGSVGWSKGFGCG